MARLCLDERCAMEWPDTDPMLRQIVFSILREWPRGRMIATSIWRDAIEDREVGGSGIHTVGPPYRAIDIRTRTLGMMHQQEADAIASRTNARFVYDPRRANLGVAVSIPHGTGPHLHIQVHPRTQYRVMMT